MKYRLEIHSDNLETLQTIVWSIEEGIGRKYHYVRIYDNESGREIE